MTGFGCRCGARWTARGAAHCGACHATFGGLTGFDRHRRRGACLDEATLVAAGLTRDGRGTWRLPVTNGGWTGPVAAEA